MAGLPMLADDVFDRTQTGGRQAAGHGAGGARPNGRRHLGYSRTSPCGHEHNNVLILGPTGSGKSFLACAIGNQAARGGFSVRYQRLTRLLDELALARVDGKATRLLAQLARIQLLIIDDWAMARLTAERRSPCSYGFEQKNDSEANCLDCDRLLMHKAGLT